MARWLRTAALGCEALLEMLAPTRCVGCDTRTALGVPLCNACRRTLERPAVCSLAGIPVVAAAIYRPPIQDALRRLKYASRPDLARPLARLLAEAMVQLSGTRALLAPVPVHRRRLAERGYNQAALLTRELARLGPWKSAPLLLARRHWSGAQVGRGRAERLENVRSDFVVRQARRAAGQTIIVVDDVVTTGATAYSCLLALRAAGAEVAAVAAVARAGGAPEELLAGTPFEG
ncbi:MAG: ComF family protein [Polyangiaceae bacterium]|nr:ComF family protein [Polyangiaceae bacterium]